MRAQPHTVLLVLEGLIPDHFVCQELFIFLFNLCANDCMYGMGNFLGFCFHTLVCCSSVLMDEKTLACGAM